MLSFGGKYTTKNIDWSSVFKRNLTYTREHRIREFNFILLFNILPVRNNLYKWILADDRYCPHCHVIKDIVHVFIECQHNKNFFDYIKHVVKYNFNIDFVMDISRLFKINIDREIDVVTTIAFWCIYYILVIRNKNGFNENRFTLRYVFEREIKNRIVVNQELKKPEQRLPKKLLQVI